MSEQKLNETLVESLDRRQQRIQQALAFVRQTKELFEKYGSSELKTAFGRFDNLAEGLKSSQIRLVVIGEFSRGKSSLVNALLGVKLLQTALEATTAINTFIHSLPEGENSPYIVIHFKDADKPEQRLPWNDDEVLKKWGTELDAAHKDARRDVKRIDIYRKHELLDKGLILVDTPGLESVIEHHHEITMEAIDQAHVAIWVQSASHLGGNAREWNFLKGTIRKNFRKFITVVNMWDKVINPEDEQDKQTSQKIREREKMEIVKRNFREQLENAPPEELAILTSGDNLMGVSAQWGREVDPELRRLSRIDDLAERIAELCTGEEAQKEKINTPLMALRDIQATLLNSINEQINLFNSPQDLNERKRELELLEQEIKNQELEQRNSENEARTEHQTIAVYHAKNIQGKLVQPLKELKEHVDLYVTRQYVKKQIERASSTQGEKKLGLPDSVQSEFENVTKEVEASWVKQKKEIENALSDLRVAYQESMNKRTKELNTALDDVDIELPKIDISLNIDLSSVEEYQKMLMELQTEKIANEQKYSTLENDLAQTQVNKEKIALLRENMNRAERDIQNLGPQPAPIQGTKSVKVSSGGIYTDAKYTTVSYTDDSNVNDYKEEREKLRKIRDSKEAAYQKVIEDEERKSGLRMTIEAARKKVEAEIKRLERTEQEQLKQADVEKAEIIEQAYTELSKRTSGELSQRITFLESQTSSAVEKIFTDQLELLLKCVEEQFMEPLRAKRSQREQAMESINKGEVEVKQRLQELEEASCQLTEVASKTQSALVH